ncbi:MAG: hypothetical protein ACAI44_35215 [Candidatus Sericytochromatia bacterium]
MPEQSVRTPLPIWVSVIGILLMAAGIYAGYRLVGRPWGFIAGGTFGGALLGAWNAYWQKRLTQP